MVLDATGAELYFWWFFLVFFVASLGARAVTSVRTRHIYENDTVHAPWSPPAWFFGWAWLALYVVEATAAYLVRATGTWEAGVQVTSLVLFIVLQFVLALWSWFFFRWRYITLAFVDLVVAWVLALIVTILFWRQSLAAGILMLVFVLWLTYAASLQLYELYARGKCPCCAPRRIAVLPTVAPRAAPRAAPVPQQRTPQPVPRPSAYAPPSQAPSASARFTTQMSVQRAVSAHAAQQRGAAPAKPPSLGARLRLQ